MIVVRGGEFARLELEREIVAVNRIVAGAAIDGVRAGATFQVISRARAEEEIVAFSTRNEIGSKNAKAGVCDRNIDILRSSRCEYYVVAAATEREVVVAAAF